MDKPKGEKLSSFLVRAGSILLAVYVIFLMGRSVWTNYDLRSSIEKLNAQIAQLEEQKKELKNLNIYYQSDSFKELEARRKLGMKKPDEKVVIISNNSATANFQESILSDQAGLTKETNQNPGPNWSRWLDFFSNR